MKQPVSAWGMIALLCVAQVFVQIGAFFWPALLPKMVPLWSLSNSEAGWITAIFYGAYMVSVPVLVTLTDRIDPKRIYLLGVAITVIGHLLFATWAHDFWSAMGSRALTGMGWAGTYMTGLKLLADRVDAKTMSRATASHAASIGISGAMSFAVGDLIADAAGWQTPFMVAAATSAIAWVMIALFIPRQAAKAKTDKPQALFDFRPVFRNRSAMAYAFVYAMHTLEMSAVRGWAVAFLGYVALQTGHSEAQLSPAILVTILALLGTVASIGGNEASIRFGRRRLIKSAVIASIVFALLTGIFGPYSYTLATGLLFAYGFSIWLDSSSLTAGTAGTAEPSRRGATLAVHSMLGYAGGFVGPLIVGLALDFAGGMSPTGWSAAFASLAACMAIALVVFWMMRPAELAGDRQG
jgi:predicted MFS family arabinose efflux permease